MIQVPWGTAEFFRPAAAGLAVEGNYYPSAKALGYLSGKGDPLMNANFKASN